MGLLNIEILSAYGVNISARGNWKVFCRIVYETHWKKTKAIKGCHNPLWKETITIPVDQLKGKVYISMWQQQGEKDALFVGRTLLDVGILKYNTKPQKKWKNFVKSPGFMELVVSVTGKRPRRIPEFEPHNKLSRTAPHAIKGLGSARIPRKSRSTHSARSRSSCSSCSPRSPLSSPRTRISSIRSPGSRRRKFTFGSEGDNEVSRSTHSALDSPSKPRGLEEKGLKHDSPDDMLSKSMRTVDARVKAQEANDMGRGENNVEVLSNSMHYPRMVVREEMRVLGNEVGREIEVGVNLSESMQVVVGDGFEGKKSKQAEVEKLEGKDIKQVVEELEGKDIKQVVEELEGKKLIQEGLKEVDKTESQLSQERLNKRGEGSGAFGKEGINERTSNLSKSMRTVRVEPEGKGEEWGDEVQEKPSRSSKGGRARKSELSSSVANLAKRESRVGLLQRQGRVLKDFDFTERSSTVINGIPSVFSTAKEAIDADNPTKTPEETAPKEKTRKISTEAERSDIRYRVTRNRADSEGLLKVLAQFDEMVNQGLQRCRRFSGRIRINDIFEYQKEIDTSKDEVIEPTKRLVDVNTGKDQEEKARKEQEETHNSIFNKLKEEQQKELIKLQEKHKEKIRKLQKSMIHNSIKAEFKQVSKLRQARMIARTAKRHMQDQFEARVSELKSEYDEETKRVKAKHVEEMGQLKRAHARSALNWGVLYAAKLKKTKRAAKEQVQRMYVRMKHLKEVSETKVRRLEKKLKEKNLRLKQAQMEGEEKVRDLERLQQSLQDENRRMQKKREEGEEKIQNLQTLRQDLEGKIIRTKQELEESEEKLRNLQALQDDLKRENFRVRKQWKTSEVKLRDLEKELNENRVRIRLLEDESESKLARVQDELKKETKSNHHLQLEIQRQTELIRKIEVERKCEVESAEGRARKHLEDLQKARKLAKKLEAEHTMLRKREKDLMECQTGMEKKHEEDLIECRREIERASRKQIVDIEDRFREEGKDEKAKHQKQMEEMETQLEAQRQTYGLQMINMGVLQRSKIRRLTEALESRIERLREDHRAELTNLKKDFEEERFAVEKETRRCAEILKKSSAAQVDVLRRQLEAKGAKSQKEHEEEVAQLNRRLEEQRKAGIEFVDEIAMLHSQVQREREEVGRLKVENSQHQNERIRATVLETELANLRQTHTRDAVNWGIEHQSNIRKVEEMYEKKFEAQRRRYEEMMRGIRSVHEREVIELTESLQRAMDDKKKMEDLSYSQNQKIFERLRLNQNKVLNEIKASGCLQNKAKPGSFTIPSTLDAGSDKDCLSYGRPNKPAGAPFFFDPSEVEVDDEDELLREVLCIGCEIPESQNVDTRWAGNNTKRNDYDSQSRSPRSRVRGEKESKGNAGVSKAKNSKDRHTHAQRRKQWQSTLRKYSDVRSETSCFVHDSNSKDRTLRSNSQAKYSNTSPRTGGDPPVHYKSLRSPRHLHRSSTRSPGRSAGTRSQCAAGDTFTCECRTARSDKEFEIS
ncbi:hypothetical protein AAMO2058_001167300 [Amorphochlora amoebiformis]